MSKQHWKGEELTCKPLDTYEEILLFLENPPPWRTLCKELTPHSKSMLKNIEINKYKYPSLDSPETFCHFDPEAEDVIRYDEKILPKTLVCHDMANGYHDDSYIDGTSHNEAYTFYNWAGIDIFCYFSHHLITIPPLGWINVGHAHGVKIIGTLITEWAEGIQIWNKVLASEKEYQNFANSLVAITKTLKFDGWLLNVENKVIARDKLRTPDPRTCLNTFSEVLRGKSEFTHTIVTMIVTASIADPASLLEFVKYFNVILHQAIPHAVLIWYDSVTVQGTLNWQNGLNEKNKAFFDACDGIFTNYSWSERDVAKSALVAGDRIADLYIGIDVWGRNFFGGGEFNTQEAVGLAHAHGCSLAIFAPAWTHEAMSREKTEANVVAMTEDLDDCQLFLLRDRALWGSLWPFLNTRVPSALPFKTSFCRGLGVKRRMYGEVLCNAPWYNLRHQQYQPNSAHGPHGYLLSSSEDIQKDRNTDYLYKDGKGILRYRASFQRSRQELHSVNSKMITDNNMIADNEDNLNTNENQKENEEDQAEPQQSKRKDTADDREEEVELGRSDQNDGRGRSMMQMSVNLKLGSKGTRQRFSLACVPGERECLEVYQDDSFNGGSCLRINPSDNLDHAHRHTRLFHCDFYCEDTLIVCVVTKKLSGFIEQFLNIELFMKDARNQDLKVILIGRSLSQPEAVNENSSGIVLVLPLETTSQPFREMQKYLLLNESAFYVPLENSFGWTVRYYEVHSPGARVASINCRTGLPLGPILLGHVGVCHRAQLEGPQDQPSTSKEPSRPHSLVNLQNK